MEPKLFQVIVDALGNKERTAKVYANQIKRVYKQVYKKPMADNDLQFIRKAKTLNFVKKIVNLTRRKNAATALLVGLQAIKAPVKKVNQYRDIMMTADKDYQKFLQSGVRKRPFENAEAAWSLIVNLHKKVAKEIDARPAVQRAINSTNAADFGQLEPNLSAAAKAAMGAAMVKEIEVDLSRPAEQLALALVKHYHVELEPGAIDFLAQNYGARKATLTMLSNYHASHAGSDKPNVSYLSQRPPMVGKPHRDWYRALVRARRALGLKGGERR